MKHTGARVIVSARKKNRRKKNANNTAQQPAVKDKARYEYVQHSGSAIQQDGENGGQSSLKPEDIRKVKDSIERGSSKKAVDYAKTIHKRYNNPDSEKLLVEAYLARIDSLIEKKMYSEARSLTELVESRYSSARQHTGSTMLIAAARDGDVNALADKLNSPDVSKDQKARIEEVIRTELVDIVNLARCNKLADEHPLKKAACAVEKAFEAVTSGQVEDEQVRLPEISRRSPLSDWKYLLCGIGAFYQHKDDECKEFLSRIKHDSAVYGLVEPLQKMISGETENVGKHEKALISRVTGGNLELKRELEKLDKAFESGNNRKILNAVSSAVNACIKYKPEFLKRLKQHISIEAVKKEIGAYLVMRAMKGCSLHDSYWWRLYAIEEQTDPVYSAACWNQFYKHALHEGLFEENSNEAAILFEHMADLLRKLDDIDLMELSDGFKETFEGFDFQYEDQPDDIYQVNYEVEGLPDYDYLCPDKLYEKAVSIRRDSGIYRKWLKYYFDGKNYHKKADRAAEKWHSDFPTESEPLLYLAESAEDRKAFTKALKFLQKAEAVDGLNPKVKKARLRLLLLKCFDHLDKNKTHLAEKDLVEIAEQPAVKTGSLSVFLSAIKWAIATQQQDKAKMSTMRNEIENMLNSSICTKLLLYNVSNYMRAGNIRYADFGFDKKEIKSGRLVAEAGRGLLIGIEAGLSFAIPFQWQKDLEKELNGRKFKVDSSVLDIFSESVIKYSNELAFAASGAGLRMAGSNKAKFLKIRAQSLPYYCAERRRACFAAAAQMAKQQRDMDLLAEIVDIGRDSMGSSFLGFDIVRPDTFSMEPDEVESVIKDESKEKKFPKDFISRKGISILNDLIGPGAAGFEDECNCPECRKARGEKPYGKKKKVNRKDQTGFLFDDMDDMDEFEDEDEFDYYDDEDDFLDDFDDEDYDDFDEDDDFDPSSINMDFIEMTSELVEYDQTADVIKETEIDKILAKYPSVKEIYKVTMKQIVMSGKGLPMDRFPLPRNKGRKKR